MVTSRQCFPQARVVGFGDGGIVRRKKSGGETYEWRLMNGGIEGGKEERRRGS